MKSNAELQNDVQNEINYAPMLNPGEIGVTAKDGLITLTGVVDNYSKKLAAENAAKRVKGVKAVAEGITIKYSDSKINDTEIGTSILTALKGNRVVPYDKIAFGIENRVVILTGEVDWKFQSKAAEDTIKFLPGVELVFNQITIGTNSGIVEKQAIKNELGRNILIDAKHISVDVCDNVVTLKGTVASVFEKEEAGRVAWYTPGVDDVKNDLFIGYDE
ncbi:MAG: BON domain-containing protein [Ferruginibacter sp.]